LLPRFVCFAFPQDRAARNPGRRAHVLHEIAPFTPFGTGRISSSGKRRRQAALRAKARAPRPAAAASPAPACA
jgi:hypothetical protein